MMNFHETYSVWKLYAHLPRDTNWDMDSYKCIMTFDNIEHIVSHLENIPNFLIRKCMLFLMRDDIEPIWEDPQNCKGGSFSYKVFNEKLPILWRELCYTMVCEGLSKDHNILSKINGISVSPKKNFSIIKIWMADCETRDIRKFKMHKDLIEKKVIFKAHKIIPKEVGQQDTT